MALSQTSARCCLTRSMTIKSNQFTSVIIFIIAACLTKPALAIENHALLIGVSNYADERIIDLEGPQNDVAALKTVLIDQWEYPANNITTLVNEQATEESVLSAIEELKSSTEPGDSLFLYFSGHGTSARDNTLGAQLHLPNGSGAIVAHDFDPEQFISRNTIDHTNRTDGVIVGRSDLRPLLDELNKTRTVFVVFDACFSGNTARGVNSEYTPHTKRYVSLNPSRLARGGNISSSMFECSECANKLATDYPYTNVVYFGASAEHELAVDISQAEIEAGLASTIDGKAHGAFTDALLRSLVEPIVGDSSLSFRQLFQKITRQFKTHCDSCGHSPVMLPSSVLTELAVVDQPVYPGLVQKPRVAVDNPPSANSSTADNQPAVVINESTLAFAPWLAPFATRNITGLSTQSGTILLSHTGNALEARSVDGRLITRLNKNSDDAQNWIAVRYQLQQRLVSDRELADELAVELAHPLHGNEFYFGEKVTFSTRVNKPSRLLVLALDAAGDLHRLYPADEREWAAVLPEGEVISLPESGSDDLRVTGPAGTDELLFYALPENHPAWVKQTWLEFDSHAVNFEWLDGMINQSPVRISAAHRRLIAVAPE